MADRDFSRAIVAEAERLGLTNISVEMGGKHPKLRFEFEGQSRFMVFSGTPSDRVRGLRHALGMLRRMVRQPDTEEKAEPAPRPRPKRRKVVVEDAAPTQFTVRPDPLLALAPLHAAMQQARVRSAYAAGGQAFLRGHGDAPPVGTNEDEANAYRKGWRGMMEALNA